MQSGSRVPPDFSIGYKTDVEEGGGNGLVFALVLAVGAFLVWLKRSAKRR